MSEAVGTIAGTGKRFRLGAGAVVANGPNPTARILFLNAVARCVPEALTTLASLPAADDAVLPWAEHWGFTDTWMLRHARNHVRLWADLPDTVGRWLSYPTIVSWQPIFPAPPSAWSPMSESESAYRARIEAYIATVKATPGATPTPERRKLDEHFEWLALHHVGRLTYEQIADRYYQNDDSPKEKAIGHAITDTAALVGLTLRFARGRKSSQRRRS